MMDVETAHLTFGRPHGVGGPAGDVTGDKGIRAVGQSGLARHLSAELEILRTGSPVGAGESVGHLPLQHRREAAGIKTAAQRERGCRLAPPHHCLLEKPFELLDELALVRRCGRLHPVAPPLMRALSAAERNDERRSRLQEPDAL